MSWLRKNENKICNSEEYEKLNKKIIEISGNVEELRNQFKILETNYNNLRGNFNRKLSGLKNSVDIAEKEETQSINNPVILPE